MVYCEFLRIRLLIIAGTKGRKLDYRQNIEDGSESRQEGCIDLSEDKQNIDELVNLAPQRDLIGVWFLKGWFPPAIVIVATCTTIAFGFKADWELAAGVFIAGIAVGFSSWVTQFYRKQLIHRDKTLLDNTNERVRALERSIEQRNNKYAAELEARESVTKERESEILALKTELSHTKGTHKAVIDAMYTYVESTRIQGRRLYKLYKKLSQKKVPAATQRKLLSEARELGNKFLLESLEGIINIFRPLIPIEDGVPVKLWAAVRQHNSGTRKYDTTARHGHFTPVREDSTEGIPENRSIAEQLRDAYNTDGAGILILKPGDYDKLVNDKYEDNLSIMAGPIIIDKEMPMFIMLNSHTPGVFHEGLKLYMKFCTSFLSEAIRPWSELVEVVG